MKRICSLDFVFDVGSPTTNKPWITLHSECQLLFCVSLLYIVDCMRMLVTFCNTLNRD